MTSDLDRLTAALGGPPPPGVLDLDVDGTQRLAELVERARADQGRRLDEAIDGGLNHLPRLLRGTIRKVLFQ